MIHTLIIIVILGCVWGFGIGGAIALLELIIEKTEANHQ